VNKRTLLALVILFICALTTVGVIASIKSVSPKNQNSGSDCEQACTKQYRDCIGATDANRPQCQQARQSCLGNCKKNAASPSPTAAPTASAVPTKTLTPKL